jgi:hypothetical protein
LDQQCGRNNRAGVLVQREDRREQLGLIRQAVRQILEEWRGEYFQQEGDGWEVGREGETEVGREEWRVEWSATYAKREEERG